MQYPSDSLGWAPLIHRKKSVVLQATFYQSFCVVIQIPSRCKMLAVAPKISCLSGARTTNHWAVGWRLPEDIMATGRVNVSRLSSPISRTLITCWKHRRFLPCKWRLQLTRSRPSSALGPAYHLIDFKGVQDAIGIWSWGSQLRVGECPIITRIIEEGSSIFDHFFFGDAWQWIYLATSMRQ